MYQPEPLNWIAGAEIFFSNLPPHLRHLVNGLSLIF